MKSPIKPLRVFTLVVLCTLACGREAPVARLQVSPRTLSLPYPHAASLELTWLPLSPLAAAGELEVSVHLIDRQGNVQRTFDHPFPESWEAGSEVSYRLPLAQSAIARPLPPGSYDLIIGLFTAAGDRWPLEVAPPGPDQHEHAVAEVLIPYPAMVNPRFDFSGAWHAPQETGVRQILATRWLSEKSAELMVWDIDQPGEAVLSFRIPRLQEQGFQLRAEAPATVPAVAVESDCGGVRGRLSGYGAHEIRVAVAASASSRRCAIRFAASSYFITPEDSRKYSALLESATWAPAAPAEQFAREPMRRLITRSPEVYSVALDRAAKPETVILRNAGDRIVVDPRVIVNGRKDWFNIDSILAEIIEPGYSDRAKAMAIWRLLVANRYHDFPTRYQYEMHDPVRLLNVYGYGFCDDASNSFMALAKQAGLKARVWHLSGHVVSEAYYDGDWHMFDADGELFYALASDQTIAGVRRLARSPQLIRNNPSPNPLYYDTEHIVDLYTSRRDNRVAGWYDGESRHIMAFDLRPGESIMRSRKNWGRHVTNLSKNPPELYGNGRFSFEPVLRDELFRLGASEATGLVVEAEGVDRRVLVFTADGDAGRARLSYEFASPYPVVGGRVRIAGELRGHGSVELELAQDGEGWSRVWQSSAAGEIDRQISLDAFLSRKSERPVYRHHLRVAFSAHAEGARLRLEVLRFDSDFQLAPRALPSFEQGANEVRYVDAGDAGERRVELIFEYGG